MRLNKYIVWLIALNVVATHWTLGVSWYALTLGAIGGIPALMRMKEEEH